MDTLRELLELERSGWESLCDGSGSRFYAGLMTDDALMILADGVTMTRDEVAAALQYAPPWASFAIANPRVITITEDVAILVYVGTGFRDEGDAFTAAMSSTYVRGSNGWQLALYQQTPAPTSVE
ncbi:MAG: nuclear transport factor 2 family protein [Acidimicrobiia bacterium]|nr:nuclear transport factor 2 family protein [Acidimicrobiia bacterium]